MGHTVHRSQSAAPVTGRKPSVIVTQALWVEPCSPHFKRLKPAKSKQHARTLDVGIFGQGQGRGGVHCTNLLKNSRCLAGGCSQQTTRARGKKRAVGLPGAAADHSLAFKGCTLSQYTSAYDSRGGEVSQAVTVGRSASRGLQMPPRPPFFLPPCSQGC